jgi:hypothetical protein
MFIFGVLTPWQQESCPLPGPLPFFSPAAGKPLPFSNWVIQGTLE